MVYNIISSMTAFFLLASVQNLEVSVDDLVMCTVTILFAFLVPCPGNDPNMKGKEDSVQRVKEHHKVL